MEVLLLLTSIILRYPVMT
uniref:MAN5 n=1 Tax=Arundo donax TaxID=35708 RepID=A0A0A8ZIN4_ARUDO